MIVKCPKCNSKYRIADSEVPAGGCAVKCLECSNIFTIYKEPLDIKLTPLEEESSESELEAEKLEREEEKAQPSAGKVSDILRKGMKSQEKAAVEEAPSLPEEPEKREEHRKAKRLGRSLVKDILLYHKDKVKRGRKEGKLVQLLGEEIKKSWKFYKKQVDPEVLKERNYFKEALNEIIAEGKEIFK